MKKVIKDDFLQHSIFKVFDQLEDNIETKKKCYNDKIKKVNYILNNTI